MYANKSDTHTSHNINAEREGGRKREGGREREREREREEKGWHIARRLNTHPPTHTYTRMRERRSVSM